MNTSEILLEPGNNTSLYLQQIFIHPSQYFELGYMQSLVDSIELIGLAFIFQFLILLIDSLNIKQAKVIKYILITCELAVCIGLMMKLIKFYTGV